MAMLPSVMVYSSNKFQWHKDTVVFSAEASELGNRFFSRLYDDAIDEGFMMISERTGKRKLFSLTEIHKDVEGDIQYWEFTEVDPPFKLKVIVYND